MKTPGVLAMLRRLFSARGGASDSVGDGLDQLFARLEKYASDHALGEEARYRLAERLTYSVYPQFRFSEYGRVFLEDKEFLAYYERFMDADNWHSFDRKWFLKEALGIVAGVSGDLVECGTYKGATAFLLCQFAKHHGRQVFLFDSFLGLSVPAPVDGDYWSAGALSALEEELRVNLDGFDCFTVLKGWIPERFHEVSGHTVAFCHVDVDLYQPTLDSVAFFYPRMRPGGIMLFDDYGFRSCPGARQAVDEFFRDKPENVIMVPTGQAFAVRAPE